MAERLAFYLLPKTPNSKSKTLEKDTPLHFVHSSGLDRTPYLLPTPHALHQSTKYETGEVFAEFFGMTQSRYQNVIDAYHRRKRWEEEDRRREEFLREKYFEEQAAQIENERAEDGNENEQYVNNNPPPSNISLQLSQNIPLGDAEEEVPSENVAPRAPQTQFEPAQEEEEEHVKE